MHEHFLNSVLAMFSVRASSTKPRTRLNTSSRPGHCGGDKWESRYTCGPPLRRLLALAVLLAVVNGVHANTLVFLQDQLDVAGQSAGRCVASRWMVACDRAFGSQVYWSCGPFQHEKGSGKSADAVINLHLRHATGPLACTIPCATARTDVASGIDRATVAAFFQGTGQAQFDVTVHFHGDAELAPAGSHSIDILTTVTGR